MSSKWTTRALCFGYLFHHEQSEIQGRSSFQSLQAAVPIRRFIRQRTVWRSDIQSLVLLSNRWGLSTASSSETSQRNWFKTYHAPTDEFVAQERCQCQPQKQVSDWNFIGVWTLTHCCAEGRARPRSATHSTRRCSRHLLMPVQMPKWLTTTDGMCWWMSLPTLLDTSVTLVRHCEAKNQF